jgi:hypothetical protein
MSGVLVLTGGPRCLGGLTPGSKPKVSRRPRWLPSNAASGVTGAARMASGGGSWPTGDGRAGAADWSKRKHRPPTRA